MCLSLTLSVFAEDVIPEPTLSPDAEAYDPEHPENLDENQLYAVSAILVEASTGNVIFEKNADQVMYPASTTKILTVLLGILCGDLDAEVTATASALNIPDDASNMDLREGETINFLDLLYGTMLRSANEGAQLIAEVISGSIPEFVNMMNDYVSMLGLENTHFANPDGYHDDNHYTTVRDMSVIAREAIRNKTFRQIASTYSHTLPRSNVQRARTLVNTAMILKPSTEENYNKYYYPDAIGIKTGSTSKAGYCFVGAAERDGVELVSVVFMTGNRARWADTIKLLDYGFSQYVRVTPVDLYNMNPLTIETTNYSLNDSNMGKVSLVCKTVNGNNVDIIATVNETKAMASNLMGTVLIEYVRGFEAPITAGETIATMTYFPEGKDPVTYNLTAARSVARRENVPKTVAEIYAEADADPNPFPPLTVEMVAITLIPVLTLVLIILLMRFSLRRRRKRIGHVPTPKKRFLK